MAAMKCFGCYVNTIKHEALYETLHALHYMYTFVKDLSICPGRKDSVSVCGENREKERKQKRLVLANFKRFTKLLRLHIWCKHRIFNFCLSSQCVVCVHVCIHHQTPKLKASVCDLTSKKA